MSDIDFKRLSRDMAGREGLSSSLILITITSLLGLAILWASWAELDNVTRGEGRIVSSVQNQLVQAAEGGVILRRYVAENSKVAEGEILFEIDPVDASSELNRVAQRIAALDIKELRLRSEIEGTEFFVPADLGTRSPMVALTEQSLFAARRAELAGQMAVLEQRLQQRVLDLRSAESILGTAERTAGLLEE
jgi:adhesin transport system membrane fusion protein